MPPQMVSIPELNVPQAEVAAFCQQWQISRLEVFGSILRDDFDPLHSDVDLLVTFLPSARWTLFDLAAMREAASAIFSRRVDLVERQAVERSPNPIRRSAILKSARVIYAT